MAHFIFMCTYRRINSTVLQTMIFNLAALQNYFNDLSLDSVTQLYKGKYGSWAVNALSTSATRLAHWEIKASWANTDYPPKTHQHINDLSVRLEYKQIYSNSVCTHSVCSQLRYVHADYTTQWNSSSGPSKHKCSLKRKTKIKMKTCINAGSVQCNY